MRARGRTTTEQRLKEQVKLLNEESEGHDGDGRADPSEERPLIGSMVAVATDHKSLTHDRTGRSSGLASETRSV